MDLFCTDRGVYYILLLWYCTFLYSVLLNISVLYAVVFSSKLQLTRSFGIFKGLIQPLIFTNFQYGFV